MMGSGLPRFYFSRKDRILARKKSRLAIFIYQELMIVLLVSFGTFVKVLVGLSLLVLCQDIRNETKLSTR